MCIVPWDKTPVQRRGLPACNMQAETRAVDLLYSPSCAIPTSLRQQRPRSYCLKCLVVQVLLAVTRAALGHKLQIVAKSNHTPSSKGWILESSSPQSALQPIKWAVCSQALWRPGRKACCEFSCVAMPLCQPLFPPMSGGNAHSKSYHCLYYRVLKTGISKTGTDFSITQAETSYLA